MNDWRRSNQYRRIQEILEDYWLSEPDEAEVVICMTFRHSDGSVQNKHIIWKNPNIKSKQPHKAAPIKKLSEVGRPVCACM